MSGFTLLEVLLAISLAGFLVVGVLDIFFTTLSTSYELSRRSEIIHQLMSGVEVVVSEVQDANPVSITFLEADGQGGYSELKFLKYGSPDVYWFYVNADGQLIRGVQRPGYEWGRTTVAETVESMRLKAVFTLSGELRQFELILQSQLTKDVLQLSTTVSPGF